MRNPLNRKYRIVQRVNEGDWIVQWKGWFFWHSYTRPYGIDFRTHTHSSFEAAFVWLHKQVREEMAAYNRWKFSHPYDFTGWSLVRDKEMK